MKRKQLTIFLDPTESETIELIRKQFNPRQYALIKSHITLCREDEIEDISGIRINLENLNATAFDIGIGKLKRFSDGEGVLLTVLDKGQKFQQLRTLILANGNTTPRKHNAHVTLMHPRNSTCDDTKFKEILQFEIPKTLRISKISLIEQEIGKKWKTLNEYELKNRNDS